MTEDQADFRVLSLANEKRKFAVPVGGTPGSALQEALERGMDNEWWTLVDVSPINARGGLMRVFRLTDAGLRRLAELSKTRRSG